VCSSDLANDLTIDTNGGGTLAQYSFWYGTITVGRNLELAAVNRGGQFSIQAWDGSVTVAGDTNLGQHSALSVTEGVFATGNLTLYDSWATLGQSGGTINVGHTLSYLSDGCTRAPSFAISNGTMNVGTATDGNRDLLLCAGTGASAMTVTGGTVNVQNGGTIRIGLAGDAEMRVQGGTVNAGNGVVLGNTVGKTGTLDISGGTFNVVGGNIAVGPGMAAVNLSRGVLDLQGHSIGNLTDFSFTGGTLRNAAAVGKAPVISGADTLVVDATATPIATSFTGGLVRGGQGTLVVVPYTGNLGSGENVTFTIAPPPVLGTNASSASGIIAPWSVAVVSGGNDAADFVNYGPSH
jgi:hypothetical protein